MSLGSGCVRRLRSCAVAAGVTVMAALRARSLDFRGGGSVTGLLFWASDSGRLIFWLSSCRLGCGRIGCSSISGGLVSWTSGFVPAIEVSGIPVFRGGAGGGCRGYASKECGR